MGPIAVWPEIQRKGIDSRMVAESLQALRKMGLRGCVLAGDQAFYTRFGFHHELRLTLEVAAPEVFMALFFGDETPQGKVAIHPAFFVEAE